MDGLKLSRREAVAGAAALGTVAALAPRMAKADSILDQFAALIGLGPESETPVEEPAPAVMEPAKSLARPRVLGSMPAVEPVGQPSVPDCPLAGDLSNVVNLDWYYLNDMQLDKLRQFGFFCMLESDKEFFDIYEQNRYAILPNFVTVDSMMHTYHLYFSHLMKTTERGYLTDLLRNLSAAMLEKSSAQLDVLRGTEWESAAVRNTAFFAVGCCLLGMEVGVPADVSELANAELDLIYNAAGVGTSPSFGEYEDYSQYIPRGYYEGDEALEGYFRAMMWYGRMPFLQKNDDLDRSALLVVLALSGDVLQSWSSIYTVTAFFAGASDDNGYYEYAPLVEQAFGGIPEASSLPGNPAWDTFHQLTAQTPGPKINSVAVEDKPGQDVLNENKSFRLMGQRFTVDESVFQQLVYSKVGDNLQGQKRMLPDVLDVMAAMGSDEAMGLLDMSGAFGYEGYSDNMAYIRDTLAAAGDETWQSSLYAQWLRTLQPLCEPKGEGYPNFMRSPMWARKCLQTFAGSYAELKHDTILYAKQMMAEMGGGDLPVRDDRGYVEPEPEVFGRLAAMTQATSDGLSGYGLLSSDDAYNLSLLSTLASQLEAIARKELRNELPTEDEFELIRTFGGQLEHFWREAYKNEATSEYFSTSDFPSAIVADIATDPNGSCLEVATGKVSEIYVVVPFYGELRLMTGTVYSFYQFEQPLQNRLTDTEWRRMMGIELNESNGYNEPAMDPIWWAQEMSMSWRSMW